MPTPKASSFDYKTVDAFFYDLDTKLIEYDKNISQTQKHIAFYQTETSHMSEKTHVKVCKSIVDALQNWLVITVKCRAKVANEYKVAVCKYFNLGTMDNFAYAAAYSAYSIGTKVMFMNENGYFTKNRTREGKIVGCEMTKGDFLVQIDGSGSIDDLRTVNISIMGLAH